MGQRIAQGNKVAGLEATAAFNRQEIFGKLSPANMRFIKVIHSGPISYKQAAIVAFEPDYITTSWEDLDKKVKQRIEQRLTRLMEDEAFQQAREQYSIWVTKHVSSSDAHMFTLDGLMGCLRHIYALAGEAEHTKDMLGVIRTAAQIKGYLPGKGSISVAVEEAAKHKSLDVIVEADTGLLDEDESFPIMEECESTDTGHKNGGHSQEN